MQDATPESASPRDPRSDPSSSSAEGLVRFLVESPSLAGLTREALSEAVHSLLRERDYLRRARDLQNAEHEADQVEQRRHAEELERLRDEERRAYLEQVDSLRRELIAHQERASTLGREHDELLKDRDAWRARATRSLWNRVTRTLRGLLRKDASDRRQSKPG